MARTDLPSGGWVELRDPATVRVKDRKQVLRAAGSQNAEMWSSPEMVIALAVDGWSFELALPRDDTSVLDELAIPDYDAIIDAVQPFSDALFPDFKAEASGPKVTSTV